MESYALLLMLLVLLGMVAVILLAYRPASRCRGCGSDAIETHDQVVQVSPPVLNLVYQCGRCGLPLGSRRSVIE